MGKECELMKNIKLKQTNLCFAVTLLPIILPTALFLLSVIIADYAQENSIWQKIPFAVMAIAVIAVFVFLKKLGTKEWIVLFGTIMAVEGWNKDRRFYFTDINGRTSEEVTDAVKIRMNCCGKELETGNKSDSFLGAYKKRRHSFMADTSGFEDYCILYKTQSLTNDFCSNAVSESKSIMRKYAEKGTLPFLQTRSERRTPVTKSCALVIVCDSLAGFDAEKYVHRNFTKGHTGLAVCIYEASTGRYFLNGTLFGYYSEFQESKADKISAKLIKKIVFCKRMGLSENSYFMPTDSLPCNPEMTIYEVIGEIKKETKNFDRENKRIVKRLKDGEVYFDSDGVFYKKNGRTLMYSVMSEEDAEGEEKENGKKFVLTDKSWSYPKSCKMSKKDFDEALIKITEYLNQSGIEFEFTDFEKWLEQH